MDAVLKDYDEAHGSPGNGTRDDKRRRPPRMGIAIALGPHAVAQW